MVEVGLGKKSAFHFIAWSCESYMCSCTIYVMLPIYHVQAHVCV
jgi:hypothetical protein